MILRRHSATGGSPAMRRKARKPRQVVPVWRRSRLAPAFWRVVDDGGQDSFGRNLPGPDTRTMELWRLTLEARSIPHVIVGHAGNQRVFVPALWEGVARSELAALTAENLPPVFNPLPARHNAHWALLALLALVFWHGLISGWWPLPFEHLPDPAHWLTKGRLDVYRVRILGEWWRVVTALTLHADSLHLFSNVLFGLPFFVLMARRLGLGLALALTLLSGICGNILNTFYQPNYHTSIGFSTALFGMVGVLSADLAVRDTNIGFKRRVFLPLAAALALLAMLGTQGERTDYAAHVFGLCSGYALGLFTGSFITRYGRPPRFLEWLVGAGVLAVLVLSWNLAFN